VGKKTKRGGVGHENTQDQGGIRKNGISPEKKNVNIEKRILGERNKKPGFRNLTLTGGWFSGLSASKEKGLDYGIKRKISNGTLRNSWGLEIESGSGFSKIKKKKKKKNPIHSPFPRTRRRGRDETEKLKVRGRKLFLDMPG